MNAVISEDDLHAYADGQLPPARLAQVEAWLEQHPDRRQQVEAWRVQAAALHVAFDPVLDEPVPAGLVPAANARRWVVPRKVAAVAWLAIGLVAGYVLRGASVMPAASPAELATPLPKLAAVAHAVFVPEKRHPVEVGAEQEAHLVAWLSKRLGAPLQAPRLESAGYRLVGGRLLAGDRGEVAQFMYEKYEDAAHQRVTVYVRPHQADNADTGFRYAREHSVDVFYWIDGPFGYALSGNTGRESMLAIAQAVYMQQQTK